MKTCFKCKAAKPLDAFYKHPKMADGHLNKCKECTKQDAYESRHTKHRDRVLEYDRARAKAPERKERAKDIYARWKAAHPKRRAAQVVLGNAIRRGAVQKLPCFVCGENGEAHHPDYDRPLDVVWLCAAHHRQTHAMVRP